MEYQTSFLSGKTKSSVDSKKTSAFRKIKGADVFIFTDGASRGNPGIAGIGVYAKQGVDVVIKAGCYVGEKTNNQAEYLALALALFLVKKKICRKDSCPRFIIIADSELLVRQMNGTYKVKNPVLKNIKRAIDDILDGVSCSFQHVLREKNKAADQLANQGIDKKKAVPEAFASFLLKYDVKL
jgi:ribonuclease HI